MNAVTIRWRKITATQKFAAQLLPIYIQLHNYSCSPAAGRAQKSSKVIAYFPNNVIMISQRNTEGLVDSSLRDSSAAKVLILTGFITRQAKSLR